MFTKLLKIVKRPNFLLMALLLLVLANVMMMSSPVFAPNAEGFVAYIEKLAPVSSIGAMLQGKGKDQDASGNDGFQGKDASGNEGFQNAVPAGAKNEYMPMGAFDGVNVSEDSQNVEMGPEVEVGQDNLFMFKDNKTSPDCCGDISNANGCVCVTKNQRNFINSRGGNRTLSGDF